ncbi:MAG: pentapeptide repeat-containing protein [Anaerolineae bacterium]|nr:pentapeptide repeat-containing protein [Anaerolineae bacterium]
MSEPNANGWKEVIGKDKRNNIRFNYCTRMRKEQEMKRSRQATTIGVVQKQLRSLGRFLLGISRKKVEVISEQLIARNTQIARSYSPETLQPSLQGLDLRRADLSGLDLRWADFRDANLERANLSYAVLAAADFRRANLVGVDLRWASLSMADLEGADVSRAQVGQNHWSWIRRLPVEDYGGRGWEGAVGTLNPDGLETFRHTYADGLLTKWLGSVTDSKTGRGFWIQDEWLARRPMQCPSCGKFLHAKISTLVAMPGGLDLVLDPDELTRAWESSFYERKELGPYQLVCYECPEEQQRFVCRAMDLKTDLDG